MGSNGCSIPAWELTQLRAVTYAPTVREREASLTAYLDERERRRRYARVRDAKDRERRTLVGAHMNRADVEMLKFIADREDLSLTAFVKLALRQAVERSDTYRGR